MGLGLGLGAWCGRAEPRRRATPFARGLRTGCRGPIAGHAGEADPWGMR